MNKFLNQDDQTTSTNILLLKKLDLYSIGFQKQSPEHDSFTSESFQAFKENLLLKTQIFLGFLGKLRKLPNIFMKLTLSWYQKQTKKSHKN